ncbi:MAG: DUF4167 domain-containing protein [Pseudomonadota bacterium]
MINSNRQQNGRRRGRGGQQRQGGGGGGQGGRDTGNRIDSRARGNAAQLLEKYKSLARDAQMHGDRVNTEYYLQFADHYFRVVSEQRGRFEDQTPQQRRGTHDFDQDDEFEGEDGAEGAIEQPQPQARDAQQQGNREQGRDGQQRDGQNRDGQNRDGQNRDGQQRDGQRRYEPGERGNGYEPRADRAPRDGARDQGRDQNRERSEPRADVPAEGVAYASEGEPIAEVARPRRPRAPRRDEAPTSDGGFDIDRLPPSFAPPAAAAAPAPAPANDGDGGEDAVAEEKPRRRRLRPASDAG